MLGIHFCLKKGGLCSEIYVIFECNWNFVLEKLELFFLYYRATFYIHYLSSGFLNKLLFLASLGPVLSLNFSICATGYEMGCDMP